VIAARRLYVGVVDEKEIAAQGVLVVVVEIR